MATFENILCLDFNFFCVEVVCDLCVICVEVVCDLCGICVEVVLYCETRTTN